MLDDWTKKAFLVVGGALALFIIIGDNLPEKEPTRSNWLPPIPQPADVRGPSRAKQSKTYSDRPWVKHQKRESEEWLDFIEDLDNRGLDVWDPEAEDIWEENY